MSLPLPLPGAGAESRADYNDFAVRPPVGLAVAAMASIAGSGLCLVSSNRLAHWIGYTLGAWVLVACVLAYRRVDARRSGDRHYLGRPSLNVLVAVLLAAGMALAALHAYSLSTVQRFG